MIVLMARCTASTNVVSPGAAWGERRPSRQEAGHRGAGRRTLSKLASSMTYVAICQPPWRYTGTTKGMWSPTAMRPSVPPSERPAALRKCWSGWYSGSRLRTPAGLAAAAPGGGVDAGPRRPGQGHGPPQAVPQGRHAPLTRPVAAWDLAGWPRQRPIRGRVQGPGRGAADRSPTCRSTAAGRRASRWVGTPSDAEIPTDKRPGRPAVCRSTPL
jgi:hypothetical protein